MKAMLRRSMSTLVGLVALMVAPAAFAEGEPCENDDDCPNPACGGDVCNWNKMSAQPMGSKIFYCQPAGRDPKGQDGWCTDTSDCKCKGEGATCIYPYCTATQSTMSGGGTGAGGTAAGGTAAGGTAAGGTGTSGSGGSTAGTSSTAGTGTTPPAEDSGCSVAAPVTTGGGIALMLGMIGVGAACSRRRRR